MRKIDFDITNPEFLYKMDEHTKFLFDNEPRGFYWHPTYKHWIIFSMDKLKEASLMNEDFSLATTSPAPFDPTPLGGVWRAGYALTLREGEHHHLAKIHSRDWLKRNASLYLEYFRNNIDRFFSQVKKGESFKGYEVAGRVITHTQIQMIHFPYHILDVDEEYVKEAFTDWMRPGNVFSNFNPDFDYDKPVAQSTEFYAMFSDIVHKAIEYYRVGDGKDADTMINMTESLNNKQWEFNDKPEMMAYMFIQSLWTVVIPTFGISLLQFVLMCMCKQIEIVNQVQKDRSLIPDFAREILRLAPPKGGIRDVPKTVNYHGYKIDFGSRILLYTYGANRDPAHFKDPYEFKLHRPGEPDPVTLAYGPHHCTGDFVVKKFIEILIEEMLDRFEKFEMVKEPELLPAMFGSTTVYKDLEMKFS